MSAIAEAGSLGDWVPGVDVAPETWPENGYDWLGPEVLIALARGGVTATTLPGLIAAEGYAAPTRVAVDASLGRLREAGLVTPRALRLSAEARALIGGVRPTWWQRRFWYAHLGLR